MKFITEPPVPRKRPDLTTFIHRPLQHFRELLKLFQMIASYCRLDTEEYNNFQTVIAEIQVLRNFTHGLGSSKQSSKEQLFTKILPFIIKRITKFDLK